MIRRPVLVFLLAGVMVVSGCGSDPASTKDPPVVGRVPLLDGTVLDQAGRPVAGASMVIEYIVPGFTESPRALPAKEGLRPAVTCPPGQGTARIDVFDYVRRLERHLYNGELPVPLGVHWDGFDGAGNRSPSDLYRVRIQTECDGDVQIVESNVLLLLGTVGDMLEAPNAVTDAGGYFWKPLLELPVGEVLEADRDPVGTATISTTVILHALAQGPSGVVHASRDVVIDKASAENITVDFILPL